MAEGNEPGMITADDLLSGSEMNPIRLAFASNAA
jgi:hypothetical protein